MLHWAPFAGFMALLLVAAVTDLRARRIPNWLTAGIAALYPVYVLTSPQPVAWPSALGLGVVVLMLGAALFARRLMGGGDVKLITSVSLWAGVAQLPLFALVTSLVGGVLALATLWYQRWAPAVDAHLAVLGINLRPRPAARAPQSGAAPAPGAPPQPGTSEPATLPYGVAIAAGGLAVAIQLFKP